MKKIILLVCAVFFLMVGSASAFIVEVGFDDSLDFSLIHGFEFTINGDDPSALNLVKKFHTEGGALPAEFSPGFPWDIAPTMMGYSGFDFSFGSFPLSAGIAFSLEGAQPVTLSNFLLANNDDSLGKYPLPFIIKEVVLQDGMSYTYSNVPIPSSLFLLGGGIFALLGISRRKKG